VSPLVVLEAPSVILARQRRPIVAVSERLTAERVACDTARADALKIRLREWYYRTTVESGPNRPVPIAEHWERAVNFWGEYEGVNRRLCPDDPVYSVTRAGTAPATTADFWGYISPAAGQTCIYESVCQGEGTATVVNRWQVQRTTGLFAGGVTITPEKANPFSIAAQGTAESGGTTALTGAPIVTHAFNAFSGSDRWLAPPGGEIYCNSGGAVVCRPASGAGTASGYVWFEEK